MVVSLELFYDWGGFPYKVSKGEWPEGPGVHLRREVRVHRMIRQLVPALPGVGQGIFLLEYYLEKQT